MKPRHSEVNSYWMCNTGRKTYAHLNKEFRLLSHYSTGPEQTKRVACQTSQVAADLAKELRKTGKGEEISLLVSAQYTNQEYQALFDFFVSSLGVKKIYQWRSLDEQPDDFDGLLERGDRNSNTGGLLAALQTHGLKVERKREFDQALSSESGPLLAFAPEVTDLFPSFEADLARLASRPNVTLFTLSSKAMAYPFKRLVATKGFAEKTGSFTGFDGTPRQLEESFLPAVKSAVDLQEFTDQLRVLYSMDDPVLSMSNTEAALEVSL